LQILFFVDLYGCVRLQTQGWPDTVAFKNTTTIYQNNKGKIKERIAD